MHRLLYAIKNHDLYIKIEGAGTVKDYRPLKDSVVGIVKAPFLHRVEIDLSDVSYVDSTFIGLLLGINKILRKNHKEEIELCNLSENLLTLLEDVEVAHLFKITDKPELAVDVIPYIEITKTSQADAYDILEAHNHLSEICEANRKRFSLLSRVLQHSSCKK